MKDRERTMFRLYHIDCIAFAELVSYIEETSFYNETVSVFRLKDLASMYEKRLTELNQTGDTKMNSTRLKDRLLLHCPYLTAVKQGRDVLLTYDVGIGVALLNLCYDEDEEAIHLAEATKIV